MRHLLFRLAQKNSGFTLIELLVVIVIIGILSAIALPSFLNQSNKARQSEAKTYVGSMNKGQQVHYTERGSFTSNFEALGVGFSQTTPSYIYSTEAEGTGINASGVSKATLRDTVLQTYAGKVALQNTDGGLTSVAILCEQDEVGVSPATPESDPATGVTCADGQTQVGAQ